MTAVNTSRFGLFQADRLLLVAPAVVDDAATETIARRYADWRVTSSDTYLSGIAELARSPANAILAFVDPRLKQMGQAVAGLREAAGPTARLILCCTTETEASARELLGCGADDYVLHPIRDEELDAAMGISPRAVNEAAQPATPATASLDELHQLSEILAHLPDSPTVIMQRIAELIRLALGTPGALVVVQGTTATAGEPVRAPVLSAPLVGLPGSISVSARVGAAYSPDDVRKLEHYVSVVSHVLQAAARQRHWQKLATTDECSGLPNRRYLRERLGEILAKAAVERFPVTLSLFDIDDFKSYNDKHGHDMGDAIIKRTGELFRRHCREHDVVTRYGGDEFAVVFWDEQGPRVPGSQPPQAALSIMQRFREALRTEKVEGLGPDGAGRLTISGGLATYPWDAQDAATLISRADQALLAAKRAGKNRILLIGEQG